MKFNKKIAIFVALELVAIILLVIRIVEFKTLVDACPRSRYGNGPQVLTLTLCPSEVVTSGTIFNIYLAISWVAFVFIMIQIYVIYISKRNLWFKVLYDLFCIPFVIGVPVIILILFYALIV